MEGWLTYRHLGLLDGNSKQLCKLLGPLGLCLLLVLRDSIRASSVLLSTNIVIISRKDTCIILKLAHV